MTPTILTFILDDDPTIAVFIDKLLNKGGFNIMGFTDPETFRSALSDKVNLVLLDINIPGYKYDVNEMIGYLHQEYPGIYIIIISGFLNLENILKFWRAGAFDAIDKNVKDWHNDLRDALDRVLPKIKYKLDAICK